MGSIKWNVNLKEATDFHPAQRTRGFSRTRTISTVSNASGISDDGLAPGRLSRQYSTISTGPSQSQAGNIQDGRPDIIPTKRTLWQLITLNTVAMGIEFCYATETALVTPTLLQMGLPDQLYSITWILSPTLGFLMNPVIGSLSDRCRCSWGRRRPFIAALCVGVLIGLTLFLNGEEIGIASGDTDGDATKGILPDHTIGLIITTIGVVLLDYSADSCDSPSKAYMIDVCDQEDLDRGLNIRALLGGLGGAAGYILNSFDWEQIIPVLDQAQILFIFCLVVAIICFILTLTSVKEAPLPPRQQIPTINKNNSEERKPLLENDSINSTPVSIPAYKPTTGPDRAYSYDALIRHSPRLTRITHATSVEDLYGDGHHVYSSPQRVRGRSSNSTSSDVFCDVNMSEQDLATITESGDFRQPQEDEPMSALQVLVSIVQMPSEMKWLCLTHLFSWSAVLTQFLFFTDYMGQVVFNGDPRAPEGSQVRKNYQDGVQMGCWGMVIFGVSTMIIAGVMSHVTKYISNYTIYVWGQVIFAIGLGLMAIFNTNVWVTLALCVTCGIHFVTVTTIPFSILAGYHESYQKMSDPSRRRRGLGTDVACICSTNFLAQIAVSAILGAIIDATGTELTIVLAGSLLAFIAAFLSATFVTYKIPVDKCTNDDVVTNRQLNAGNPNNHGIV